MEGDSIIKSVAVELSSVNSLPAVAGRRFTVALLNTRSLAIVCVGTLETVAEPPLNQMMSEISGSVLVGVQFVGTAHDPLDPAFHV